MTIAETVKQVLADHFAISDVRLIGDQTTWKELDADSLDVMELILHCEEVFGFQVPDADAKKLAESPVGETVKYVEAHVNTQ